jgi:hypothetical protein
MIRLLSTECYSLKRDGLALRVPGLSVIFLKVVIGTAQICTAQISLACSGSPKD